MRGSSAFPVRLQVAGRLRVHDTGGIDPRACRGLGSPHRPPQEGVGVPWASV